MDKGAKQFNGGKKDFSTGGTRTGYQYGKKWDLNLIYIKKSNLKWTIRLIGKPKNVKPMPLLGENI